MLPGSAAEQAGIRVGDRLVALDGMALDGDWEKMVAAVQASQGRPLQVTLQRRDGGRESVTLTPRQDAASGEWKIGLASQPDRDWMQSLRYVRHVGPVDAIGMAVAQTWQTSALTLKMMGRMLTGAVSPSNISGPITMADFAGKSVGAQTATTKEAIVTDQRSLTRIASARPTGLPTTSATGRSSAGPSTLVLTQPFILVSP